MIYASVLIIVLLAFLLPDKRSEKRSNDQFASLSSAGFSDIEFVCTDFLGSLFDSTSFTAIKDGVLVSGTIRNDVFSGIKINIESFWEESYA